MCFFLHAYFCWIACVLLFYKPLPPPLCPPKRQKILTVPEVDWAEAMQDGWTERLNNFWTLQPCGMECVYKYLYIYIYICVRIIICIFSKNIYIYIYSGFCFSILSSFKYLSMYLGCLHDTHRRPGQVPILALASGDLVKAFQGKCWDHQVVILSMEEIRFTIWDV